MWGTLSRNLRLARQFIRIGVIRKSQFRVEFLCQVVMDTAWYAVHVLTFEVLFEHTRSIAGWDVNDIRVFLGFLFVSDAFWMIWLGQCWHFGRELKDGKLDPLRVRPGSPVFLYFFQRFSLEACVNGVMAASWLVFALTRIPGAYSLGGLALVVWGCAIAFWCRVALSVLFSIAEFFFVNSDLSNVAWEVSLSMADRPADVFPLRYKQFLTSLVPVAAVSTLPAALVLHRISLVEALAHTAWLALFGLGVFRLWRASFRKYESALG